MTSGTPQRVDDSYEVPSAPDWRVEVNERVEADHPEDPNESVLSGVGTAVRTFRFVFQLGGSARPPSGTKAVAAADRATFK